MKTPARELLKCLLLFGFIIASVQLNAQNSVGIGTNSPNTNSVLELVSTGNNQGFLMPRMSTAQRTDASFTSGLTNTENGLMVFDTDEGAIYFWYSGSWVNSTSLLAGAGIQITGNTIENIGDTDDTDDLTNASVAAGDVTGDFANLSVTAIQGNPVSGTAPTLDYVLKWDGSQWLPQPDAGNVYTAGTGIDVSGNVITNTGDTDASDDITTATIAAGDATGDFGALQVTGIQGNPVDPTAPTVGQVLKWDGTQWLASADADDQDALLVPFDDAVAALGVTDVQSAIEALDAILDGLGAGDMLQSTYDTNANSIVDLAEDAVLVNGLTVMTAVPAGADFTDDQTAAEVAVTPVGNLASTDVQSALVELQTDIDGAAGDMTQAVYDGNSDGVVDNAETVGGLTVLTAVPAGAVFTDSELPAVAVSGDVLEYNGSTWVAAPPSTLTIPDGTSIGGDGDVTPLTILSVDPALLTPGGATVGQILEHNGSNWVPANPSTFTNTDGTSIVGDGDATPLSVGAIEPTAINPGGAIPGQVLEWNGTNWAAANQSTLTNTDGTSIVGDGDATPLSVGAIEPTSINPGGAIPGQVLEWNGTNWAAANQSTLTNTDGTSIVGDGDATPLSVGAVDPSLITAGTATVGQILEYNGSNWVPVNQSPFTNSDGTSILGDGDATPLSVGAVDPSLITAGTAIVGQILEYNGSNWVPVNQSPFTNADGTSILGDGDATPLSVGAVDPSLITAGTATVGQILEYNGSNWVPVNQSPFTNADGTSILGDGDATPLSVGAVDPSLITAGTATVGQILEYNGSNWVPVNQSPFTNADGTSILGDGDATPLSVGAVDPSLITDGGATIGQRLEYNGANWVPVNNTVNVTANEVPRGDGTSQVSSNIFSDGTNIGIGQAAPLSTIHLNTDNHIISEGGDLILTDNIHLVTATPTYTQNGRAVALALSSAGGNLEFFTAPSGVAGNTAPLTSILTVDDLGGGVTGTWQSFDMTVAGNGATASNLHFGDADNTDMITLKSPEVLGASTTYTLPPLDGTTGQVLSTDGAGALSWVNSSFFNNVNEIPKGDGAGLVSSDIYSSGANDVSIGSSTPLPGVKFGIHNQAGTPLYFGATNYSNNPNDGSNLGLLRARGTQGGELLLQSGDAIGSIGFNVWDGTSTHISSASIKASASVNHVGGSDYGTQLSIATTADGTGVEAERIRINGDGSIVLLDNTSIGNGPTSAVKLQITPDGGQNNALRINPESTDTNTGEFQMMELGVNGTDFVGFKAPANIPAPQIYTLPATDGTSGQVLSTDGVGNMSWVNSSFFSNIDEIPRGDGSGLVSSNIFSNGSSVAIGLGAFTVPLTFSVVQESGGPNVNGIVNYSGVAADDGSTWALVRARGNDASPADVLNGDRIGTLAYTSHSGTFNDAATIQVSAAENHTAGVLGSTMSFRTAALGETSNAQRLLIDQNGDVQVSGNLGIGIPPAHALDVTGDVNVSGAILKGGAQVMDVNTTTFSTYLGDQAGNAGNFNTMVGYQAGGANTANQNAFFGYQAGQSNTSGASNTFLGGQAGNLTTTGSQNTVVGFNALRDNIIGVDNTIVGSSAGINTTGNDNTFVGRLAGSTTTGNSNTFIGSSAGENVGAITGATAIGFQSGRNNSAINTVFVGYNAGLNNGGANNTFIGYNSAGVSIGVSGTANTALGANSAANLTTGTQNALVGYNAGNSLTAGMRNSFLGMNAGLNTDSDNNVMIGYTAGSPNTSGQQNTMVGALSGQGNTTGTGITLLGYNTDVGADGLTNATAIGNGAQVNTSNSLVLGAGLTNVGIGTSAPSGKLDVNFTTGQVFITGSSNQQFGVFDVTNNGTGAAAMRFQGTGQSATIGIDQSDANKFKINMGTTFAGGEDFTIDATGNVGIQTTTPRGALDVNGAKYVSVATLSGVQTNTAIGGTEYVIYLDGSTSGNIILPPANAGDIGRVLKIICESGTGVQVDGNGADNIFMNTLVTSITLSSSGPSRTLYGVTLVQVASGVWAVTDAARID